jgi:flagellar motor switch protein FliN
MAQPPPAPASVLAHASATTNSNQPASTQALVPVPPEQKELLEPARFSPVVALLPVELDVTVPVRNFRVRNLLALEPGQLIESQRGHGEDVPLASAEVQLAWSEFEVVESQLAVRITRLA